MNALINLKDTITINNKNHQIKLSGTIEDPYFCGQDVGIVLGYVDIKKALQRCIDDNDDKKSLKELIELGQRRPPTQSLVNTIITKCFKDFGRINEIYYA